MSYPASIVIQNVELNIELHSTSPLSTSGCLSVVNTGTNSHLFLIGYEGSYKFSIPISSVSVQPDENKISFPKGQSLLSLKVFQSGILPNLSSSTQPSCDIPPSELQELYVLHTERKATPKSPSLPSSPPSSPTSSLFKTATPKMKKASVGVLSPTQRTLDTHISIRTSPTTPTTYRSSSTKLRSTKSLSNDFKASYAPEYQRSEPVKTRSKVKEVREKGLLNENNNCYLNSCLTALFSSTTFLKYFKQDYHYWRTKSQKLPPLFSSIFSGNLNFEAVEKQQINFNTIQVAISSYNRDFAKSSGFQQDVHDFFISLCDNLDAEIRNFFDKIPSEIANDYKETPFKESVVACNGWRHSFVTNTFDHTLSTTLKCKVCQESQQVLCTNRELLLPTPTSQDDHLTKLIAKYLSTSNVNRRCTMCEAEESVSSKVLDSLPRLLCICIRRYNHIEKVSREVFIPTELDLSEFSARNASIAPVPTFNINLPDDDAILKAQADRVASPTIAQSRLPSTGNLLIPGTQFTRLRKGLPGGGRGDGSRGRGRKSKDKKDLDPNQSKVTSFFPKRGPRPTTEFKYPYSIYKKQTGSILEELEADQRLADRKDKFRPRGPSPPRKKTKKEPIPDLDEDDLQVFSAYDMKDAAPVNTRIDRYGAVLKQAKAVKENPQVKQEPYDFERPSNRSPSPYESDDVDEPIVPSHQPSHQPPPQPSHQHDDVDDLFDSPIHSFDLPDDETLVEPDDDFDLSVEPTPDRSSLVEPVPPKIETTPRVSRPIPISTVVDEPKSSFIYNLTAVICHQGSKIASGHYYVYIRKNVKKSDWLLFNDLTTGVESVTEEFVLNDIKKVGYMMFYQNEVA
ncbi:hypothetical protein GEMRC1_001131 [Eukaryota sp. GEM-RC1]